MWDPIIKSMQSKSESERLGNAESDIVKLKEIIADLEKRIEKLEKKENDK